MDETLEAALTCRWRKDDGEKTTNVRNEIIPESGGPLTFGLQIGIAYLTGLIGPTIHSDLKIINKVRNKFAHRTEIDDCQQVPSKVSFKTDVIRGLCKNLVTVDHVPVIYDKRKLPVSKSRHRYLATCIIFLVALDLFAGNPTKPNKIVDGILKA